MKQVLLVAVVFGLGGVGALAACNSPSAAPAAPAAPPAPPPAPLTAADAPRLYDRYRCLNCHGPDGKGHGGQYDLSRNRANYPTDEGLAAFIRNPREGKPDCQMPPYDKLVKDDELAVLVSYVRTLSPAADAAPKSPASAEKAAP